MKAALAQSWNPKGPCKASWRSSKTTQGRSPHTHADAWPPHWLSFLGEPAGRANGLGDWQNKGDQPDVGQMAGQSQGAWLGRSRATVRQDRHPFGPPHRSSSMSGSASSCHSSLWTLLRRLGKKQRLLRLPRYQLIWDGRQGGDCNLEEWETSLPKLSDGRVPQPLIALLEHTPFSNNRVEPAEGSMGLASAGSTGQ